MPLYQTGGYRVKPSAENEVKQAIKDFVAYVQSQRAGHADVSGRLARKK
jgi:hypothetical protein